jgi:hypothetical protein
MYQYFIPFYDLVIFHWMDTLQNPHLKKEKFETERDSPDGPGIKTQAI